jgi:NAD(P)H-nitrite reductase large subunit
LPTAWWRPLFEQAKVAANHLAMFGIGRYTGSLTSTKLKVTGIDLFSAATSWAAKAPKKSS